MKKLVIALCILYVSIGTILNAQDSINTTDEEITTYNKMENTFRRGEVGLRFMPTFSSFDVQTSSGGTIQGKVTLGFGMGALLGFNFNDYIGVQGEVIYSALTQTTTDQNVEQKIDLKYLNIPLLVTLNTGKSKFVNFNVVVGPQIGLNVGSSLTTTGNNETDTTYAVLKVKKGDLGFAYGAGLDFGLNPAHNFRLSIGYRGVFGLFDISDNSQTMGNDSYYILDRSQIKTNSLYAGLSFLF
ncbi:MAG: porin family protein [Chitinophagales bacterium]